MAPTKKKPSSKEKKEVVLFIPTKPYNLSDVTVLEWFRMTYHEEPLVAMRLNNGNSFFTIDKNGQPGYMIINSHPSLGAAFIDYLTEDEGVFIPGSAKDRPEIKETEAVILPFPEPLNNFNSIPDNIPFKISYDGKFIYDVVIRKYKGRSGRGILLIGTAGGVKGSTSRDDIDNFSNKDRRAFIDYLEIGDLKRFDDHPYKDYFVEP